MILMGTAFGIIFPLGMVLGVCLCKKGTVQTSGRTFLLTLRFYSTRTDCPLALARPRSNCRHHYRRASILPRPRSQGSTVWQKCTRLVRELVDAAPDRADRPGLLLEIAP